MAVITVLGAGAMGSALTRPLVEAGWQVRLWGSIYDDAILDAIDAGQAHPTLKETISPAVTTFRAGQLAQAVNQAQVVVISVASGAVVSVLEQVGPYLDGVESLWLTSKGFWQTETKVELLPEAIKQIAKTKGINLPPLVAIAGPVKASECASAKPTATVFACRDYELAKRYAKTVTTPNYSVTPSQDEIGVEVCAALKNIYAIALGIADGLETATKIPHHNLKAAAFTQATKEMSQLCANLGGQTDTPYGLAGIGDLEVTGLSGRNKIYGTRLGQGQSAPQAYKEMQDLEQTVEGVSAAALAVRLVAQFNDPLLTQQLPLLHAVAQILAAEAALDVEAIISQAVLPQPAAPIADMVRIYGQDSGADQPEF